MWNPRWMVGVAIPPSLEGVDLALVEVSGLGLNLQARVHAATRQPLPRDLAARADRLRLDGDSCRDLAYLHRQLPELAGQVIPAFVQQAKVDWSQIVAIGWLGPLGWHSPDGSNATSMEIGMVDMLAERTGLTVISDFRSRDIAAGGQGAPITALPDWLLFRSAEEERVLIHLGHVTSVVVLRASNRPGDTLAWECGPGNQLLDATIQHWTAGRERFDPGGHYAVQGHMIPSVLQKWCQHPFFQRRPPRSLNRHEFGFRFVEQAGEQIREAGGSLQDLLCTVSHLLTRPILASLAEHLPLTETPRRYFLSGGGLRNGMLWRLLEEELAPQSLVKLDELGIPQRSRFAAGAALLATLALDGVPAGAPMWTGAIGGRVLGHFTPGSTRNWARCIQSMSAHWGDGFPQREAG